MQKRPGHHVAEPDMQPVIVRYAGDQHQVVPVSRSVKPAAVKFRETPPTETPMAKSGYDPAPVEAAHSTSRR